MALGNPNNIRVRHFLRDGTEVDSIEGHVVRVEDAEPLYVLLASINAGKKPNQRR